MGTVTIILIAFVAQAHTKEPAFNLTSDTQSSLDKIVDTLLDIFIGKLFDQARFLHRADRKTEKVDDAGQPINLLAVPRIGLSPRRPFRVFPRTTEQVHIAKSAATERVAAKAQAAATEAIKAGAEELEAEAKTSLLRHYHSHITKGISPADEVCTVMCQGSLLTEVQNWQGGLLAHDSKYFVDMPLLSDPKDVLANFHALPKNEDGTAQPNELQGFISNNFVPPGTDLEEVEPEDWQASPAFLRKVSNVALQSWASDVHSLWRQLVRRPTLDVLENPQRHTLLWTPHPIVVPGGRFRESYYWDSYWIVQGLLVSEMHVTARGVVENLLSFCERFGFVPNGGRSYYLDRSQPPMLSEMVRVLADDLHKRGWVEDAQMFIRRSLPVLEKEHQFWFEKRTVKLNSDLFLSHYDSATSLPRPESFREDVALMHKAGLSQDPASLFRAIVAGAESGWDFSSRWFADGQSLSSIDTTAVFPVDLNAILLRMELNLRNMHLSLDNVSAADTFGSLAASRFTAMNQFMWSESDGCWTDVTREFSPKRRNMIKAASSFVPLWALARKDDAIILNANVTQAATAVAALADSGLVRPGGVVSTSDVTGQQWDSPNAWAPVQQMLIEGLMGGLARDQGGEALGNKIANSWVETNLAAWQKHHLMFEKYNANEIGGNGGGGEYIPQSGFGWTNGVALSLLSEFFSTDKPELS